MSGLELCIGGDDGGEAMPEFLFVGIVDCHFLVFGGNQNWWWWWRFRIFLKIAGYQR